MIMITRLAQGKGTTRQLRARRALMQFNDVPLRTREGYSALIWQKEASDKSDISRKRAKCVCHLH